MDERLPGVLTEVRSLLALPERPPRALVEDTLTTGYAYVLGLEGDRVRLERRLRALVRGAESGRRDEIDHLTGRLAHADRQLASVRALLSDLRAQAL